ncbi:MAG: hypothetical protein KDK51_03510 [Deltaproteobacteria bacterium]|nr:hypothetical protein [Deltaproteobacteria bacterium]
MKHAFFYLPQTPIKPMSALWIRTLVQYDVSLRLMRYQGFKVDPYRYIDDSSMQVARLVDYLDHKSSTNDRSGLALGASYIKACQQSISEKNRQTKLSIESRKKSVKYLLQRHIQSQQRQFGLLGFDYGSIIWESDLLSSIPETFKHLESKHLLLDYRSQHGPLLLDQTQYGYGLTVLDGEGGKSFFAKYIHFVRWLAQKYTVITIQALVEDQHPTSLLKSYLKNTTYNVHWMYCARIQMNGKSISSRKGGWEQYTLEKIIFACKEFHPDAMRIGIRLYFLGKYKSTTSFDFQLEELKKKIALAQAILNMIAPYKRRRADRKTHCSTLLHNTLSHPHTSSHPEILARMFLNQCQKAKKRFTQQKVNLAHEDISDLHLLAELLGYNKHML